MVASYVCVKDHKRLFDIMESMKQAGIMPKRLRLVQQRLSKAPTYFYWKDEKGKPGHGSRTCFNDRK